MPAKNSSQRNLPDEIDELKRKIQLIDGERQAYHEKAKESIEQNKEKIVELRNENDELRKENAEKLAADEKVVKAGLKQSPEESKALRSKPGEVAIVIMDEKVRDRMNALNAARHVTRKKQAYLDSLKKRQQQRSGKQEREDSGKENERADRQNEDDSEDEYDSKQSGSSITNEDESDEAQAKRNLENRMDKSNLKCKEAEHIQRTYQQIKAKLEDEQQTFETTLDDLEREIQRMKHQLNELCVKQDNAHLIRDKAKEELSRLEAEIQRDRRRREEELEALKKERMEQDHNQRNAARLAMGQDTISDQKQILGASDDDQELMMMYESSFKTMKQAAGVSDTRKLVQRFREQGEKQRELKELMEENDRKIEELTDKKEKLQEEYDEKKYTGEENITRGENLVSAEEKRAAEEESKREEALEELEKYSHLLTGVRSGIEHLVEKLKGYKESKSDSSLEDGDEAKVALKSDEYLQHHLKICDHKLSKLMGELSSAGQEEVEMNKKMDDDEFRTRTELKLPAHNTRVKLPTITRERDYNEDNLSGDDGEVLTRQALKKQSQMIIDSKTRRRSNKRRKRIGK